jgi:ATP-dependent 26S proteasome regulatory subunit
MNQTIVFGILLTLLILYTLSQYSNHTVHAHDFYITDDAYLVTLIEEIKAETQLVNTNFLSDNNNISAIEHARNAAKITNDLNNKLIENSEDIVQVYDNGLYNSTTLAMVVANLVDEILRKYGSAYDIKYDLTNMSNMDSSSSSVPYSSSSFSTMNMTTTNTATTSNTTSAHLRHSDMLKKNNFVPVNIYDYQTAQVLSDVVNRLFSDELASQAPVNETLNIGKLEKSLRELKHAIDGMASAEALMEIAHIQIHPILQKTYDLKLVAVV